MSPNELYDRYPAFQLVIVGYADWDFAYASPYDVIEPTIRGLDDERTGLVRDLRRLLTDIRGNAPLLLRLSHELNVHFRDESQALALLGAMLARAEEASGP